MWEKLCTVPPPHGLLNGQNAARKNSTPENSWLCSTPSAARSLAPIWLVAVSAISRPTASVCAIRSFTPKACARPPALSRPDARWPSARASNVPGCTGPFAVPTPSLLSAAQDSVVVFKTSGSADQNAGPHDPSLSWGAPPPPPCFCPCRGTIQLVRPGRDRAPLRPLLERGFCGFLGPASAGPTRGFVG